MEHTTVQRMHGVLTKSVDILAGAQLDISWQMISIPVLVS